MNDCSQVSIGYTFTAITPSAKKRADSLVRKVAANFAQRPQSPMFIANASGGLLNMESSKNGI